MVHRRRVYFVAIHPPQEARESVAIIRRQARWQAGTHGNAEDKSDNVLRIDIDAMKSTGMSLMPEGMEKQIDKQALADLLEYLRRFE
jgi:hypothetical protein